jgi:hypothetical protein
MTFNPAPPHCPGYTCESGRTWFEERKETILAPGEYPPGHFWFAQGGYLAHEKSRAEKVMGAVDDLVGDLLYYDRKEDGDLPLGAIQAAIGEGEITPELIVERFSATLFEALGE